MKISLSRLRHLIREELKIVLEKKKKKKKKRKSKKFGWPYFGFLHGYDYDDHSGNGGDFGGDGGGGE